MSQQATCGQGLAEHSAFPARIADLLAAMAENLELHLGTLDPADRATQPESRAAPGRDSMPPAEEGA